MPTVNRWRGDAQGVAQVDTLTPANAEIGDTFTVICNRKEVSYTVADDDTLDDVTGYVSAVVNGLVAALTAAAALYGEYSEMTYEAGYNEDSDPDHEHPTHVVVTGQSDGMPFELTTSTTNAGNYSIVIRTIVDGSPAVNEIQRVSLPSTTSGGTFTLTFAGQTTAAIAYNASAYTLRDKLCDLSNIAGTDEVQTLTSTATGGTFTITLEGQTTAAIAFNASAAAIVSAIEAVLTAGDVTATGGPLNTTPVVITFHQAYGRSNRAQMTVDNTSATGGTVVPSTTTPGVASDVTVTKTSSIWYVEFGGAYAAIDVPLMSGSGASLTGSGSVTVTTTTDGSTGTNEIQQIDLDTGNFTGSPATYRLDFNGTLTGWIQYASGASALQSAVDAVLGVGNSVCSGNTGSTLAVEFTGTLKEQDISYLISVEYDGGETADFTEYQAGSSTDINEVQVITINGAPTGGTFTITFQGQTTAGVAYDAAAATLQTALEALSNIAPGDVTVTGSAGGPYTVTFLATYAATDVQEMTGSGASLTGGAVSVATTQAAAAGVNEQQSVEVVGAPSGGTFTLTFNAETTSGIAYNASASTVQAALEALATPVSGDVLVTGVAGGPWTVEFKGAYAATNVSAMTGSGASLTGAGTQTLTQATTTAGTGPNYGNNGDNWTLGTAPANGERWVWGDSDVPMKFGIDMATLTPDSADFDSSYTGDVGLPDWNPNGYYEYRNKEFIFGSASATLMTVNVGQGDGPGSQRMRLNTGARKTKLVVRKTGTAAGTNEKALRWKGTQAANSVYAYRGSIGIADLPGEVATVDVLFVDFVDNVENDVDLEVGDGVTLNTVSKYGGFFELWCAIVTSFENFDGETAFRGAGAMAQLYVRGGLFNYASTGTLGGNTIVSGDGELNFDQSPGCSCTNSIKRYGPDAEVVDNHCVVNAAGDFIIDCIEEPISDSVGMGVNQRWVRRDIP